MKQSSSCGTFSPSHWACLDRAPLLVRLLLGLVSIGAGAAVDISADDNVAERTQDSITYRRVVVLTNDSGEVSSKTNELVVLDHGMFFLRDGDYKESKDLIESFADGAIARYGVYQTIFSADLNAEAVFDIQTPEGQRIRGGVRSVQLTDLANGKSVVVGTVKKSVPGELIPPNQIIFRSAFDGLDADVLYVWKHNSFSQNLIVKEDLAEFPVELDPATTRLEVVTELVESPEVKLTSQMLKLSGAFDFKDDGFISFGQMMAVPGLAFPVAGEGTLNLTGPNSCDGTTIPVLKEWKQLQDGRRFVVESLGWQEIQPVLKDLKARADNGADREGLKVADGRVWPGATAATVKSPMQLAELPYQPTGYLVDLELISGTATSKTFTSGTTYYIPSSYWVTGSSIFQGNVTIKLGASAALTVSGTMTSPASGIATITSRDDDSVGERIVNAGSPPYTSDGVVSQSDWSNIGLSVYNTGPYITVTRFRIRYANHAINIYSPPYTETVKNARFESCNLGLYAYCTTVNLIGSEVCNVAVTGQYAGAGAGISETGTVTDCGPNFRTQSFLGVAFGEKFDGLDVGGVPDTMGAIGPNHFIELINGGIVIFDRWTGTRLASASIENFFRFTNVNVVFPRIGMGDPTIIYDHRSGRWFATAMEHTEILGNEVILAVSKSSDPVGDPSLDWKALKWDRFLVKVRDLSGKTDRPRLGTDDNGVYVAADVTVSGTVHDNLAAIPKGPLLANPATLDDSHSYFTGIPYYHIQPTVNFDPAPNGRAWFVCDRPSYNQDISYATLSWNAGIPSLSSWSNLTTAPFNSVVNVTTKGSTVALLVTGGDLQQAAIRDAQLWTCRTVGVNSSGGQSSADRDACEWIHLNLIGSSATVAESGRVYDNSASNQKSYIFPSIMVNAAGNVLMGFSGAGNNDDIGAFCVGRLAGDPLGQMRNVKMLNSGEAAYLYNRWGDYSTTTLDPLNSLSIWTIQEYATTSSSTWRTWIGELMPVTP